jgi:hypothetical protein
MLQSVVGHFGALQVKLPRRPDDGKKVPQTCVRHDVDIDLQIFKGWYSGKPTEPIVCYVCRPKVQNAKLVQPNELW